MKHLHETHIARNFSIILVLGLVVLTVALDRVTKGLAINYLASVDQGVFTLLINKGIIFSLPAPEIFTAGLVLIIIIGLIWVLVRAVQRKRSRFSLGLALILAGAISNMADRWLYGGVVDFIDLTILPVFNLADLAIVVGAMLGLTQRRHSGSLV